jgi:hypothetical protein
MPDLTRNFAHLKSIISIIVVIILWGARLEGQTQTVIAPELSGNDLLDYIVTNYKPATTLGYDRARDTLYRRIDLQSGNYLSCIYSNYTITLDLEADPSTDAANKGINCEHSWPQSMGADVEPQQSDMHHLYPCKDNVNSSRGNDPYMEITDDDADVWYREEVSQTTKPTSNLDEWAEKENNSPTGFEPREASKGDVARSCFYFFAMYNSAADTNFWNMQKDALYQWHYADPVDQEEYDRTYRIADYQSGQPNPFVLDSTLARRIWFTDGYSASTPSELQAGDIAIIGANCSDPDDFAFVCLTDINATTQIYFTDNGWKSDNTFRTGEGILTFTAPEKLTAGRLIVYSQNSSSFTSSGTFALSTSGDQILAYQGSTTSPRFLYAINIYGSAVWQSDATSSNTSALPRGLVNGSTCVALVKANNVKYTGATDFNNSTAALAAISDYLQWSGSSSRFDLTQMTDFSLPVELTSFVATLESGGVALRWITESEIENQGFNLYRQLLSGQYELLASFTSEPALVGAGSTTEARTYQWVDQRIQPGMTYCYLLADVSYAGVEQKHFDKVITVFVPAAGVTMTEEYKLAPVYPNPFNPSFTVPLDLGAEQLITVRLYNVSGKLVRELHNDVLTAGNYRLNYSVPELTSGLYFLKVGIGNELRTQKIILLK